MEQQASKREKRLFIAFGESHRVSSDRRHDANDFHMKDQDKIAKKADHRDPWKGVDKVEMGFRYALTLVLFALCGTCLSSCLPLPLQYHTRPDIYGTVARNGVPVENAKVRYSDDLTDDRCDSPVDSHPATMTSEVNGTFHSQGAYSFFHIIYLKPHAAGSVNGRICIDTSDGQHFSQQLSLDGGSTVGSIPDASCDQLVINCDLAKDTCTGKAQ